MSFGFAYEITPYCNLDCGFCYNVWKENDAVPKEPSFDEIQRLLTHVLKDNKDNNVEWLTFTGGEPLLHPDLERAVRFVKSHFRNVRIGVSTNGTLLDEDRCLRLVKSGVQHFEIPLFAATDETYLSMTGARCLGAVRTAMANVRSANCSLTAAMILTAKNKDHLEDVIEIAFAFGAHYLCLNRFVPTGEGRRNREKYAIPPSQLAALLSRADKKAAELDFKISVTIPIEDCLISHSDYPCLDFSACVCADKKWVIDPSGQLRTCEQSSTLLGNLLENDLSLLCSSQAVCEFKNADRFEQCSICEAYRRCGGGCRFLGDHQP